MKLLTFALAPSVHLQRILACVIYSAISLALPVWLAACGGGGAAVQAYPQTITFAAAPALRLHASASISALASSGLPVAYASQTPNLCSIDSQTGLVKARSVGGTCIVSADQAGNDHYAPAVQALLRIMIVFDPQQHIEFGLAPVLSLGGVARVQATASSGLPVLYASNTPAICLVDAQSGLVTDLTAGDCVIAANQAGDEQYLAAPTAMLSLVVAVPTSLQAPHMPINTTATSGDSEASVLVNAAIVDSGGSAITSYTAVSSPGGYRATRTNLPVSVSCPNSCAGQAFRLYATNAVGNGLPSASIEVVNEYAVVATFREPDTRPKDTLFTGSFVLNLTTGAVSALNGSLTESMTGSGLGAAPLYDMAQLRLSHQLSALYDATLGGWLVTSFLLPTTDTFTQNYGGDGWSPATGYAIYSGFPSAPNPAKGGVGNAYVRIFINPNQPTAPLTPAQLDKLAYADCTRDGMMGATCMTGTSVAGYGTVGSMSGYPMALLITRKY